MSIKFKFDKSMLEGGLLDFENKAQVAIRMYAEQSALELQNYARKTARWTDRTGHARQRLTGDVLVASNGYKLRLAHGVDYGIWLELANEKRFAIIPETIEQVGTLKVMPGFERLLKRLK